MSRIEILESILAKRVAVFDGATGTLIQKLGLTEEDYCGSRIFRTMN